MPGKDIFSLDYTMILCDKYDPLKMMPFNGLTYLLAKYSCSFLKDALWIGLTMLFILILLFKLVYFMDSHLSSRRWNEPNPHTDKLMHSFKWTLINSCCLRICVFFSSALFVWVVWKVLFFPLLKIDSKVLCMSGKLFNHWALVPA